MLKELKQVLEEVELETYNDYPQAAVNNAKRAIKYKEEKNVLRNKCRVDTRRTIEPKRKNQPLNNCSNGVIQRHQQNKDVPYDEGCGERIMWDAWGGSAGIEWAIRKLKQIDKEKLEYIPVDEDYAIINDRLAYSSKERRYKLLPI